jgi:PTH1 family peptidyl-tRNA hydrolase
MEDRLWMAVGLGNPGPRYQANRHNIGFMVADLLGRDRHWEQSRRFDAQFAKLDLAGGQRLLLVKPQTFMNLSGRAAGPLAHFYRVPVQRVIAIHDDVDLEPGRLRVKAGGGDGGHKGIRSLVEGLGGGAFFRIRCGVGRPEVGDVTGFVLQDFTPAEREVLEQQIDRAAQAVESLVTRGLKETMNRFNGPLG